MSAADLTVFMTALFIAAVIPGPGIAAIVARVLGRGVRGAAAFSFGMALGDVVWLSLAAGGLAVLAQTFAWVFMAVKWAGIAYLLYLARKMWRASIRVEVGELPKSESTVVMMLSGLAVCLGNPKVMMFYMALLPTLVDLAALDVMGFAELIAATGFVLLVVFSGYLLLAQRARGLLMSPERVRAVNRGSALFMAGAAGWVAVR